MADKNRTKKIYNSYLNKIKRRVEMNKKCNERYTINQDDVFLLGNECINIKHKSRKINKKRKTLKYKRGRKMVKKYRSKSQRGGGLLGNLTNTINTFTHNIQESPQGPSVLPWEGSFTQTAMRL